MRVIDPNNTFNFIYKEHKKYAIKRIYDRMPQSKKRNK